MNKLQIIDVASPYDFTYHQNITRIIVEHETKTFYVFDNFRKGNKKEKLPFTYVGSFIQSLELNGLRRVDNHREKTIRLLQVFACENNMIILNVKTNFFSMLSKEYFKDIKIICYISNNHFYYSFNSPEFNTLSELFNNSEYRQFLSHMEKTLKELRGIE